ncbi:MAG: hypothetical protein ACR2PH_04390 [Desulfobulbia bacterium]
MDPELVKQQQEAEEELNLHWQRKMLRSVHEKLEFYIKRVSRNAPHQTIKVYHHQFNEQNIVNLRNTSLIFTTLIEGIRQ